MGYILPPLTENSFESLENCLQTRRPGSWPVGTEEGRGEWSRSLPLTSTCGREEPSEGEIPCLLTHQSGEQTGGLASERVGTLAQL